MRAVRQSFGDQAGQDIPGADFYEGARAECIKGFDICLEFDWSGELCTENAGRFGWVRWIKIAGGVAHHRDGAGGQVAFEKSPFKRMLRIGDQWTVKGGCDG